MNSSTETETKLNARCCAFAEKPNATNRCPNPTINESNHCNSHYFQAKKLYLSYKKICSKADKYDISKQIENIPDRINYLLKCYAILNKAFNSRMKHNAYAFVPECVDSGHEIQFKIIQHKLNLCEQALSDLYELESKTKSESVVLESPKENIIPVKIAQDKMPPPNSNSIKQNILKHKKQRYQTENDFNNMIEIYIKRNMEASNNKKTLVELIVACINKIYGGAGIIDNQFINIIAIYNIVFELEEIGYFRKKDFVPEKCKECKCNNYVTYYTKLFCTNDSDHIKKYKPSDPNIKTILDTLLEYFSKHYEHEMKYFYELLIFNKQKLVSIINDYKILQHIYGTAIINIYIDFIWDPIEKRLRMNQSNPPAHYKQSKFLATLRLREKYYVKHIKNNYSDTDSNSNSNTGSNTNSDSDIDSDSYSDSGSS